MQKCPYSHVVPRMYVPAGVVSCMHYLALNQGGVLLAVIFTSSPAFLLPVGLILVLILAFR